MNVKMHNFNLHNLGNISTDISEKRADTTVEDFTRPP